MADPIPTEATLLSLKRKIHTKFHLYTVLSQIYTLPNFNSKAVSKQYLESYLLAPCPIFRMRRKDFHPPFIPTKHCNASELLEAIERLLKIKKMSPTGCVDEKPPDINWLIGVYFFLSPLDEMKLFPVTIKPESQIHYNIDSELAAVIEKEEPKTRGRSFLSFTPEQRATIEEGILKKRIKKTKARKIRILKMSDRVSEQLLNTASKLSKIKEEEKTFKKKVDVIRKEVNDAKSY